MLMDVIKAVLSMWRGKLKHSTVDAVPMCLIERLTVDTTSAGKCACPTDYGRMSDS